MKYRIQVYQKNTIESDAWFSIHALDYHPELLERLTLLGIITVKDEMIHSSDLARLRKLFRLRSCLGVNVTGAAIILDLLARVEELQEEIRHLRGY
ncbi:MAG TPA: chaperone modulator CbpM [Oscillospiraceae bacterium]|nr:chaperone modulator CbpM [Oscillospiraceae bacterium]